MPHSKQLVRTPKTPTQPNKSMKRIEQELLHELAIALYAQDLLSLGKARELAQMNKYEFGQLLAQRGILRHYGSEELDDDLVYAHRQ